MRGYGRGCCCEAFPSTPWKFKTTIPLGKRGKKKLQALREGEKWGGIRERECFGKKAKELSKTGGGVSQERCERERESKRHVDKNWLVSFYSSRTDHCTLFLVFPLASSHFISFDMAPLRRRVRGIPSLIGFMLKGNKILPGSDFIRTLCVHV